MTLCTIAGTGSPGYNGQDDRATATKLTYPSALVMDGEGRVMVSDAGNFLIRRFDGDMLTTVVGSNRRGSAVEDVSLTGSGGTLLNFVMDMKFDPTDGRLGIMESDARQLSMVDFGADALEVIAYSEEGANNQVTTPLEEAQFTDPSSIAIDDDGHIYLADAGLGVNTILKIDLDEGLVTKVAGVNDAGFPLAAGEPDYEQNHLKGPQGLVWRDGFLYAADTERHRIVKIDVNTGEVTNVVGINDMPGYGDDVPFVEAKLNLPSRFTFASSGRMTVSDTGNGVIRSELSDGTIDTVCGRGSGGYDENPQDPEGASLGQPFDLLYDASGDLVFTDTAHAVVRRISQPDWEI